MAKRVTLCICTCARPARLEKTLTEVARLDCPAELRVVVCDNHRDIDGIQASSALAPDFPYRLDCIYEPAPGISQARNAALREALREPVDFIAFLDDDEWPQARWLTAMLDAQKREDADAVFGPVEPVFENPPPRWAEHGFFATGFQPKTSNALVKADILRRHGDPWFDTRLGLAGGEDQKFFAGLKSAGASFAYAPDALVYEAIPKERVSARYIFRRGFRFGSVNVFLEKLRDGTAQRSGGALAKFGYALNHLFQSPRHPWRLYRALEDFSEGLGRIAARLGHRSRFYANRHERLRHAGDRPLAEFFRQSFRSGHVDFTLSQARRSSSASRSALLKLAYGLEHLVRSIAQKGHFRSAVGDFGEALGRAAARLGIKLRYYGHVPQRDDALPAPAVRTDAATINVQSFDSWGDFDDSLKYLTPGGTGRFGDIAFTRQGPPDWIGIFTNTDRELRLRMPPNRIFFAIGEPPTDIHRPLHAGQGKDTVVFTCDEQVAKEEAGNRRYIVTPCMTRTWSVKRSLDFLRNNPVEGKPGQLSWVTSNLMLMRGHRDRMDFLDKLRKRSSVDLYGRGFSPIDDKWRALAPYRYSIAFENTIAPYYFTEKIMDCFVAEAMPIYFGSPNIKDFFPEDAMIILDPKDPDAIAKIDEVVRSDLWRRRRDAIREAKRRVIEEYNMFACIARHIEENHGRVLPAQDIAISPVLVDFSRDAAKP